MSQLVRLPCTTSRASINGPMTSPVVGAISFGGRRDQSELIIQLLKIAIGVGFGAYFLWWSLAVLQRLPVH